MRLSVILPCFALAAAPWLHLSAAPLPDSLAIKQGARFTWDFENGNEGWSHSNSISSLHAADGSLRGWANGADPYVFNPNMKLAIKGAAGVAVRVWFSSSAPLQLYWANEDGDFSEARQVNTTVPGNQWTTVWFDLASHTEWAEKTLSKIRLDPGDSGVAFVIEHVSILDEFSSPDLPYVSGVIDFKNGLEGWTSSGHVADFRAQDGKLMGRSTGEDPYVVSGGMSYTGQGGVMAHIKSSHPCDVKLFWATTEGGFSEERSITMPVDGNGYWQVLLYDLRNHPEWAGKTITRLRLDPGYFSDIRFEIDNLTILQPEAFVDVDGDRLTAVEEAIYRTDPAERDSIPYRLTEEKWSGLSFYSTAALVSNEAFHAKPGIYGYGRLESGHFFGNPNTPNYFATRHRGYLNAPATGYYRFWVSGRSGVELHLSTDSSKYRKRLIARLNPEISTGYGVDRSSTNLWDMYGSQMSGDIYLEAGQKYYLEAIQTTGHMGGSHLGIAWAQPGKGREVLATDNLESYYPIADDADDDYLPDDWEAQYGLNPLDNGQIDITRQGERGDFDGDGLSNREEYLLGTDPTNSDTDGDGVSDYDEVHHYKTSPTQNDSITALEVPAPALTSYNAANTTAKWQTLDGGLMSDSFRGKIEWSFTVPSDGWWVIDLSARLRGTLRNSEEVDLGLRINGKSLAPQKARFLNSGVASVKVITPFLTAGTHTFELDIRNEIGRRNLQILSLKVLKAGGYDSDSNGRPDWLDAILAGGNSVLPVPAQSLVSPLFIEGSTRHVGAVGARSSGQPVTVERGLGDLHWFANIPLQAVSPTSLDVVFENQTQSQSIEWTRWNALGGAALTIRHGDSVKIGAWLSPQDSAAVTIAIGGQTQSLTANGFIVEKFAQAGVYPLTVMHNGIPKTAATITVLGADFGAIPAFYADVPTRRSFPNVPLSLWIGGEPSLTVESKTAAGTGQSVLLRSDRSGRHSIAARLPESGAIVALTEFSTIGFSDALRHDAAMYVGSTADGFRILRTPVLVTDLPPGGRVVMTIFRAGVTFMDGTTVMELSAEEFSNGVAYVDFRYPANMAGGYCHYTDIYDADGRHLGRR